MTYLLYSDWYLEICDKILERVRCDDRVGNYGVKAFELVGNARFPEVAGMPMVRMLPRDDNIQRLETNTRNHLLEFTLNVYNHIRDDGEQSFRDHLRVAGAVYDVFSRRDNTDPTLGGLVEEMQIGRSTPKKIESGKEAAFVSSFHMNVLVVKQDE